MGKFDESSMAREMEKGAENLESSKQEKGGIPELEALINEMGAKNDLQEALEGGEFDNALEKLLVSPDNSIEGEMDERSGPEWEEYKNAIDAILSAGDAHEVPLMGYTGPNSADELRVPTDNVIRDLRKARDASDSSGQQWQRFSNAILSAKRFRKKIGAPEALN